MKSYRRTFSHHVQSVTEKVRIDQKDTNRTFASEISQGMEATYVACSSYRGENAHSHWCMILTGE